MAVVICVYQDEKGRCTHAQSCLTFATSWSVAHHGISQARGLEWVAIFFFRGSSRPRDRTHVSCIGRQILYHCTTWEWKIWYPLLSACVLVHKDYLFYIWKPLIINVKIGHIIQISKFISHIFLCMHWLIKLLFWPIWLVTEINYNKNTQILEWSGEINQTTSSFGIR